MMKVSDKYIYLENSNSLIIVTGNQSAKFYSLAKGEVNELDEFKIDIPKYSDREGFFFKGSKESTTRGGAPYESKEDEVEIKVIKRISDTTSKLVRQLDVTSVFLFSPRYFCKRVVNSFPVSIRNKVDLVVKGNFTTNHPFELLEKIEKEKHWGETEPAKLQTKKFYSFKGRNDNER